MKRLDEGKVSLVDFLRSIKFARHNEPVSAGYGSMRFAHFYPRARGTAQATGEESHLVRSAN